MRVMTFSVSESVSNEQVLIGLAVAGRTSEDSQINRAECSQLNGVLSLVIVLVTTKSRFHSRNGCMACYAVIIR